MWMYCSEKVIGFSIVPLTYRREAIGRLFQAFGTGGKSAPLVETLQGKSMRFILMIVQY